MNPYAKWIAVIVGLSAICEALRRIAKFMAEILSTFRAIHRYILIHFGEHDLMCEDWCIRHKMSRHNMQTLAYRMAIIEDSPTNPRAKNGKAKGADA